MKYGHIIFILLSSFTQTITAQTPLPTVDLSILKYGLKDSLTNQVILPAKYDYIAPFQGDYAIVRDNGFYGIIDETGTEIEKVEYQAIKRVANDNYLIQKNGLFGLFDLEMNLILPLIFHDLQVIDNYAIVQNGTHYGLIDLQGHILLPFQFDTIFTEKAPYGGHIIHDKRIRVKQNGFMEVRTIDNEIVIPSSWNWKQIEFWNDTLLYVENQEDLPAILNTQFDTIIPFGKYEKIHSLSFGMIAVRRNGKYGFLNDHLQSVISFNYDQVLDFQGSLTTCQLSGKWGVINFEQDTIVPFVSDLPILFKDSIAGIYSSDLDKWALVNNKGENTTEYSYEDIMVENSFAVAFNGHFWGVLDRKGQVIIPFEYDEILLKRGYIVVVQNHKQGLYHLNGEEILKPIFEFIYPTWKDPYIMARKDGKYGYVDQQGKTVIPFQYENARNFKWGRASVLYKDQSYEIKRSGENW